MLFNQHPHKVEVGVGGSGVCDLDLLDACLDEGVEEAGLLLDGHGVREGLVSIAEVGGQPDGW